ncbi:hypothetical protein GIB67_008777 [Kingdonia uniflora]|uniref:Uncharacterized protein n=1 Tax=Kingdonia uniflora TaxID=39325 RepID=A0A7J7P623_9MAGN|nr:hypothetical protein GIB67_008777 [Kingdonia uniflora]
MWVRKTMTRTGCLCPLFILTILCLVSCLGRLRRNMGTISRVVFQSRAPYQNFSMCR